MERTSHPLSLLWIRSASQACPSRFSLTCWRSTHVRFSSPSSRTTSTDFTVTARNSAGTSDPSAPSAAVTPRTVPDAPAVEISGAAFAAPDAETVFTATVTGTTRRHTLNWAAAGPEEFTAASDGERFTLIPPTGGAYTITVTATSAGGDTLTDTATLTVFGDITGHQFVNEIAWLAEEGITQGCAAHSYCPSNPVTRAQMASFLARALDLETPRQRAGFTDVGATSVHAANIEALFAAHITTGCKQEPLQYCPNRPITRAQMAAFLHRARHLIAAARTPAP